MLTLLEPQNVVIPGLPPTASMRAGESDIELLRERMSCILGNIEFSKRHKRPLTEEDFGPYFNFAVFRAVSLDGRPANNLTETTFVA